MIEIKNLSYRYSGKTEALSDVNLSIGPGLHLLLGANGAGKTTLLHVIAGLRLATPATACTIDGVATSERSPLTEQKVFILTDDMEFPYRTLDEMVKYHAVFYPGFDAAMLSDVLGRFGMKSADRLDRYSMGNRKKAQLAYALALRTEVLLLDEPANGLDIYSRNELSKIMAEYIGEEQTVIVSTHMVFDFQNIIDSVIMLNHGRVTLSMPVWQILERVSFVSDSLPIDDALYMEQAVGRFNAIVPNPGGEMQTNIDFVLLFDALYSEQSPALQSYLNNNKES